MNHKIQKASAGFFLLMAILAASRLCAGVMKITLPPETASFKPAPGSTAANSQCLTCHSVEYVATQPPLSLNAWTAEVKKMRDKYGAPIPGDQIEPLSKYLAENYGMETNNPSMAAPTPAQTAPAEADQAQTSSIEAFATKYGCLTCHKVDAKVVGPAFKDVRAKYLNDPDAIGKIVRQIHNGGSGKWGSAIMPPFTGISDAEAKKLAIWIMSQSPSQ